MFPYEYHTYYMYFIVQNKKKTYKYVRSQYYGVFSWSGEINARWMNVLLAECSVTTSSITAMLISLQAYR